MNKCCFGFIAVLLRFDWARAATPGEPITQDELVRRTQELCDTIVTVDLCFAENRRRYSLLDKVLFVRCVVNRQLSSSAVI